VAVAAIQETKWFGIDVWPAAKALCFYTLGDHFLGVESGLEMKG